MSGRTLLEPPLGATGRSRGSPHVVRPDLAALLHRSARRRSRLTRTQRLMPLSASARLRMMCGHLAHLDERCNRLNITAGCQLALRPKLVSAQLPFLVVQRSGAGEVAWPQTLRPCAAAPPSPAL